MSKRRSWRFRMRRGLLRLSVSVACFISILLTVILAGLYYLMPLSSQLIAEQIAALDIEILDVSVGEVKLVKRAFWHATYELKELRVGDKFGGWQAEVPLIRAEVNLLGSLTGLRLHMDAIKVPEPVAVQVSPWKIRPTADISLDDIRRGLELAGDWMRLDSVSVPGVELALIGRSEQGAPAEPIRYRFAGRFQRHSDEAGLVLQAWQREAAADSQSQRELLSVRGHWELGERWHVTAQGQTIDLSPVLERPLAQYTPKELQLEFVLHLAGTALLPETIEGSLALPGVKLEQLPWPVSVRLPHFSVRNHPDIEVLNIDLSGVSGLVGTVPLEIGRSQIAFSRNFSRLNARIARQKVEAVVRLIRSLAPLPADIDLNLSHLNPAGYVRHFNLQLDFAEAAEFVVSAQIDRLSAQPTPDGWPGWTNLSGQLVADTSGGALYLDVDEMKLDVDSYFDPWYMKEVSGVLGWHIYADGVTIVGRNLTATVEDGQGTGDIAVHLPFKQLPDPSRLDAVLSGSNLLLRNLGLYVPRLEGLAGLDEYLEQAQFEGRGNIDGLSVWVELTTAGLAQFHMAASSDSLGMKYAPNWPRVEQAKGQLEILGGDIFANLDTGLVTGVKVSSGNVHIRSHPDRPDWLAIDMTGEFEGDLAGGREFLLNSDLREYLEPAMKDGVFSGPMSGRVMEGVVWIPPGDGEVENYFDLAVSLHGGRLDWPEWNLLLEDLKGEVFLNTETNMRSTGLAADIFGKPATLNITGSGPVGEPGSRTVFAAEGIFSHVDMEPWMEEWHIFLEGTSTYSAEVVVPYDQDLYPHINLHSDLVGMRLLVPEPVVKSAQEERLIDVKMRFSDAEDLVRMEVLSEGVCADLMSNEEDIGGRVWLNEEELCRQSWLGEMSLIPMEIQGNIEYASVEQYVDFFALIPEDDSSSEHALGHVHVAIDEVQLADFIFSKLHVTVLPEPAGYRTIVLGETVKGEIFTPDADDEPIVSKMERVYFPEFLPDSGAERDPSRIGLGELHVEDLRYKDVALGRWHLRTVPDENGLRVDVLPTTEAAIQFLPHPDRPSEPPYVYWHYQDGSRVSVRGKLVTNGPELFSVVGDQPFVTRLLWAETDLDLHWKGSPMEPELGSMNGSAKLRARDININLDGISSIGSVLTLLSVLNFGSLLESAFTFNLHKISGTWFQNIDLDLKVVDGHYRIQDARAESPNTSVYGAGSVTFRDQGEPASQLDVQMQIYLPIAKSLPWYTVGLANLPAGVGIYLLNLLFGDQLSHATVVRLHLGGSLAEPEFVSVGRDQGRRIWVKDFSQPYSGSVVSQD